MCHIHFFFTFLQVVHENLYNIKIRSYFLFLRKKMIFFYWLDLLLRSSRKKNCNIFFFCNCCFCMTLQQNILTIFASFCVRKYHGFCNIYMYTFFVFSKIDKNTVFTVSVHDQNTVSLPKLLNEAKIGKISHCVMRWISKQNTKI